MRYVTVIFVLSVLTSGLSGCETHPVPTTGPAAILGAASSDRKHELPLRFRGEQDLKKRNMI